MNEHATRQLRRTLLAIALLVPSAARAQDPTTRFVGTYLGSLAIPGRSGLRLSLDVRTLGPGALGGEFTSIDQGGQAMSATIGVHGDSLLVTMPTANAYYFALRSANGDTLTGNFIQGAPLPLVLVRQAPKVRPQEPKAPFPYSTYDVTVQSVPGVQLAGTISMPPGAGPFPGVVFITGSGAEDRDETIYGHKPFAVIADYLARRGIASLRMDDRGFARSTGNYVAATSADFANDAEAALHFLQKQPHIASSKVGFIGHSEGGLIAPMVAARSRDVAFLVLLAGTGIRGDTLLLLQNRAAGLAAGQPAAQLEQVLAIDRLFYAAVRASKDSADAAARLVQAQEQFLATLPEMYRAGAAKSLDAARPALQSRWIRYFLDYDPAPALRATKVPVLALNGGLDFQVPPSENLRAIDDALKAGGNRDYRTMEIPALNHLFQTARTGAQTEYGTIEETIAPVVLTTITDWILAHTR